MVRRYISVVSTRSFIPHLPLRLSLLGQLRQWFANTPRTVGGDPLRPASPRLRSPRQQYARRGRGGHMRRQWFESSARVGAEPVGPLAVAELGHHLALDLANPLAGQTEQL